MRSRVAVLASSAVAAALLASGCSSPSPAAQTSAAPASGNALVCQHYAVQYRWAQNVAQPTIGAVVQWQADIDLDVAESSGTLHTAALALKRAGSSSSPAAHALVRDCAALSRS